MKFSSVFIIILLLSVAVFAQEQELKFPGEHNFTKSIIYMDDENATFYLANSIHIVDDSVSITPKAESGQFGAVDIVNAHINDIYTIRISQGTRAGEYALYGGLLMGLSAVLAVADVGSDPYTEIDESAARSFVIGFTVGGALVGGIIGANKHKWKTIYQKDEYSARPSLKFNYGLACTPNADGLMFCLNFARH